MKATNRVLTSSTRKKKFKVYDAGKPKMRFNSDTTYTVYNAEVGKGRQVPLWLMGFLY